MYKVGLKSPAIVMAITRKPQSGSERERERERNKRKINTHTRETNTHKRELNTHTRERETERQRQRERELIPLCCKSWISKKKIPPSFTNSMWLKLF